MSEANEFELFVMQSLKRKTRIQHCIQTAFAGSQIATEHYLICRSELPASKFETTGLRYVSLTLFSERAVVASNHNASMMSRFRHTHRRTGRLPEHNPRDSG